MVCWAKKHQNRGDFFDPKTRDQIDSIWIPIRGLIKLGTRSSTDLGEAIRWGIWGETETANDWCQPGPLYLRLRSLEKSARFWWPIYFPMIYLWWPKIDFCIYLEEMIWASTYRWPIYFPAISNMVMSIRKQGVLWLRSGARRWTADPKVGRYARNAQFRAADHGWDFTDYFSGYAHGWESDIFQEQKTDQNQVEWFSRLDDIMFYNVL